MAATWVLVADSSRARILEISGPRRELREVEDLVNLTSTAASRIPELRVDAAGHEVEEFVDHVAGHLDRARADSRFARLCLIAAPRLLALLRECLSRETRRLVGQEIPRDLSRLDIDDIDAYVRGDRA